MTLRIPTEFYTDITNLPMSLLFDMLTNIIMTRIGSRITSSRGCESSRGCQHMILLNFPKKYMKLKKFWAVEGASAGSAPLRSATDDDYYYHPKRSCEGYVFTVVCLSTGGGCLLPGGVSAPGGVCSTLRQPGETATAADGTHPTGMYSC